VPGMLNTGAWADGMWGIDLSSERDLLAAVVSDPYSQVTCLSFMELGYGQVP